MIQLVITYVFGIATGAAATVIFALLIDIADRRRRSVSKPERSTGTDSPGGRKGIFEP